MAGRFFVLFVLVLVLAAVGILGQSCARVLDGVSSEAGGGDPLDARERQIALERAELDLQIERERAAIELEKERRTLAAQAAVPYIFLAVAVVLALAFGLALAYYIFRRAHVRHFERGPAGDYGYAIVGGKLAVPGLSARAVTNIDKPAGIPAEEAAKALEWAGRVDFMRAAALTSPTAAANFIDLLANGAKPGQPQLNSGEVVEADSVRVLPWVQEVNHKLFDEGGD